MAGWSKRVDGSDLESLRSCENVSELDSLLKEVNGCLCIRPFPPMLGDGKTVDLCKLYLVVMEKGGYQGVCSSGSWGVVAKQCGFDSTSGLALKLIYVKYLVVLSKSMPKIEKPENEKSGLGFSAVRMKKDEEHGKVEFDIGADRKLSNGIGVRDFVGSIRYSDDFVEKPSLEENVCDDVKGIDETVGYEECDRKDIRLMKLSGNEEDCITRKRKYSDEKMSVGYDEEHLKFVNGNGDVQGGTDDIGVTKFSGDEEDDVTRKRKFSDKKLSTGYDVEHLKIDDGNGDVQGRTNGNGLTKFIGDEEDNLTRKRKQESYLDMLKWVTELAKDPCDPSVGHLPERSKWKAYGNEVVWKVVLLLRDEMLLDGNVDTRTQYSIRQLKQKMHPSMYNDNSGSELLRCSERVISAKDSMRNLGSHIDRTLINGPTDSSAESGVWWNCRRKKVASIGSEFQADIPEWKNDIYESDSKWLGSRIWPLDKNEQTRILTERDPTGKGREDICGCEYPGEQKFHDIVKSSLLSEDESFSYWPELFRCFPHKSRETLVSYYFNVFLLRRLGQQNRMNASEVDSDDDESGYGPRSICFGRDPKFFLCSPKKARLDPI
ncbi:unnamed protein product [Withania somnifera]